MLIGETSQSYIKLVNAKAKMYEYFIPEKEHIPINKNIDELFLNTIGIVGDYCCAIIEDDYDEIEKLNEDLYSSANFFEEYINGKFNGKIDDYLKIVGAASYYMTKRVGNSLVLLKEIDWINLTEGNGLDILIFMILRNDYFSDISNLQKFHNYKFIKQYIICYDKFINTANKDKLYNLVIEYRNHIYNIGSPRELFLIDIITAITKVKISNSTVISLPKYTNLSFNEWKDVMNNNTFIKELWPSQIELGKNNIFKGKSAVIQMPTGAGKTKSIEIILRTAFVEKRTNFAIIVAPFRALCREITIELKRTFMNDKSIIVNELSDILIKDYSEKNDNIKRVVIVTPEKLMYLIKQYPEIINDIGLIIFDEAHLFDDIHRGVIYELLATTIKRNLSNDAQKILISAVIPNADNINKWFNGENGVSISSTEALTTEKSIAFIDNTLKSKDKYSLYFLKKDNSYSDDFFVPRVVSKIQLKKKPRDQKERYFPDDNLNQKKKDIAISLARRLCNNGGTVIFCGRKDTARKIVERVIEISEREYDVSDFINSCNLGEVNKLHNQCVGNIGEENIYSQGIKKGIFSHHGNIPEGMKSAIEFAMRKEYIKIIVCTSTLAQGVNLPIRYLIIPSIYQSGEEIEVRDFHNLVGRAGRSGMYTEGSILFTEPQVHKEKKYAWIRYVHLLNNENSKPCESKLLELAKMKDKYGKLINTYFNWKY